MTSPRWPAPPSLEADGVVVEPLTLALLDLDTVAYVASPQAITAHSGGRWPVDLTAAENADLIAGHVAEHGAGEAFAYALLDPTRTRELGCAYLRPLAPYLERTGTTLDGVPDGAAILTFWLVDDETARPDAAAVLRVLARWVAGWGAAPGVLRCLPEEEATVRAARSLGLGELVIDAASPYRWFTVA